MLARRAACMMMGSQQAAAAAAAGGRFLLEPRQMLQRPMCSPQLQLSAARAQYTEAPGAGDLSDPEAAAAGAGQSPPVYTQWTVYKTRGAVAVKPVRPRWITIPNGGWKMEREGSMMFEFAASSGERSYDWTNKIVIQLSPLELATIVETPSAEHNIFHDTFKGQSGREGTKSKSLRWTPAPAGSTGPAAYYLNATLNDKTEGGEGRKVQASVSLTAPEYRVFKCLVEQCMPLMLGFDLAYTGMVE